MNNNPLDRVAQAFPANIEEFLSKGGVRFPHLDWVKKASRVANSIFALFSGYYHQAKTHREKLDALYCLICVAPEARKEGAIVVSLITKMFFQGDFRPQAMQSAPGARKRLDQLLVQLEFSFSLELSVSTDELLRESEESTPARRALQALERLFCAWGSFLDRAKEGKEAFEKQVALPNMLIDRNPYLSPSIAFIETLAGFYDQIGSLAQLTSLHVALATSTSMEEFQGSAPFAEETRVKPYPQWMLCCCLTADFPPKIDQFFLKVSLWEGASIRPYRIEAVAEMVFRNLPQFYDEPQSYEEKFHVIKKFAYWSETKSSFTKEKALRHSIRHLVQPTLSPLEKIAYLTEHPPIYLRFSSFYKNMARLFVKRVEDLVPTTPPLTGAEAESLCVKRWIKLQNLAGEIATMVPEEHFWIQRLLQDGQRLSACMGSGNKTVRQAYQRLSRRLCHFQKKGEPWAENLALQARLWKLSLQHMHALRENEQPTMESFWSRFCERETMLQRCLKKEKWIAMLTEAHAKLNQKGSSLGPEQAKLWKDAISWSQLWDIGEISFRNKTVYAFYDRFKPSLWVPLMEEARGKRANYIHTLLANYELLEPLFQKGRLELLNADPDKMNEEFRYALLYHELEHPKQICQEQLALARKITDSLNPTALLDIFQHNPTFLSKFPAELSWLVGPLARAASIPKRLSTVEWISEMLKAVPIDVDMKKVSFDRFMGLFPIVLVGENPQKCFVNMPHFLKYLWMVCFKKNRCREALPVADSHCRNWKEQSPLLMIAIARLYSELKIVRPKKVLAALLDWTKQSVGFAAKMEGAVAYIRCGGDMGELLDIIPFLLQEWPKDKHKKKRLDLLSALPPSFLLPKNDCGPLSIPSLMGHLSAENLEKARELVMTADWNPESSSLHDGRKPIVADYDHFRKPPPYLRNPRMVMERILNGWVTLRWNQLQGAVNTQYAAFLESPSRIPKLQMYEQQLASLVSPQWIRWIPQSLMLPQGAVVLRILNDRQGMALFEESILSLLTSGCQKPDFSKVTKESGAGWAKVGAIFGTSNPLYAAHWFRDGASVLVAIKGSFHNRQQLDGHLRHEQEGGFNHIYLNGVPKDALQSIVLPHSWEEDLTALFHDKERQVFSVPALQALSSEGRRELRRALREKIEGRPFFERIRFYSPGATWLGLIAEHQLQTTTTNGLIEENMRWEIARNLMEQEMPPGHFMLPDRALTEASDSLFANLLPRVLHQMPRSLRRALAPLNNHGRTSEGYRHTVEEHTIEVITGSQSAFGLYTDIAITDWSPEEVRRMLRLAALLHDSGKKEGCDQGHIRRSSERAGRFLSRCKHYLGVSEREIPVILALIEDNDRFGLYLQGKISKQEIICREMPPFTRNEWGRLLFTLFMADASTLKKVSEKREHYLKLREQLNTLDFESMDWLDIKS